MTATGWTWDEALDGLTVPRFLALRAEWRRRPPAHWLLAGALGRRAATDDAAARRPTIAEMQTALPPA